MNGTSQVQTVFAAPPPGTCWGTPTTFVALLTTLVSSNFSFTGNIQFFNLGDTAPTPENRIYPWLRTISGGVGGTAGWYVFKDGSWQLLNAPITWVTTAVQAAANVYTASLSSYKSTVGLVAGDIFIVKFPTANTASASLNINSFGATVIHANGAVLTAGMIQADSWRLLEFDGTFLNLIEGVTSLASIDPTGAADPSVIQRVAGVTQWGSLDPFFVVSAAVSMADVVTYAHGLASIPTLFWAYAITSDASTFGYGPTEKISLHSITAGCAGANLDAGCALSVDSTSFTAVFVMADAGGNKAVIPKKGGSTTATISDYTKWKVYFVASKF